MKRLSLSLILGVALAGVGTVALASRNTAGTYSLYSTGNPVVNGTTISPTWANNTLGDIAAGLTDSLSRSGYGGMLAPLRTPDGTAAAPAFSFTNETGTGIYRIGSSDLGLAIGGVKQCEWTASGVAVPGTLGVTGATTLASLGVTGNGTVGGTLAVTGNLSSATYNGYTPIQQGTGVGQGSNTIKIGEDQTAVQPKITVDVTDFGYFGTTSGRGGAFLVTGRISGGSSIFVSQTGTIVASASHTGVGNYTVTVPGLTSNGIVSASAAGNGVVAGVYTISAGQFTAWVSTVSPAITTDSGDLIFTVLKL